jgi:hypothetical protein
MAVDSLDNTTPPLPEKGLKHYWGTKNIKSIDGLPGLCEAYKSPIPFQAGKIVYKKDFIGLKGQTGQKDGPTKTALLDNKTIITFSLGLIVATVCTNLAYSANYINM